MKKLMICSLLTFCSIVSCAATPVEAPDAKHPVVCDSSKPVKLFVSYVYIFTDPVAGQQQSFGNAYMCWDKDVDSEAEVSRLNDIFVPKNKGGKIMILSVIKLRQ